MLESQEIFISQEIFPRVKGGGGGGGCAVDDYLFEKKSYACTYSKYASCYFLSYVVLFYVHFGAFSMVNLALKCTKK